MAARTAVQWLAVTVVNMVEAQQLDAAEHTLHVDFGMPSLIEDA
jgi:hypothetical protein